MTVKFTNNASSSLSSGINSTATSLTVADASTFPSLSGADDYCYLTIQQATATTREVVKATARSGNTFTVQRGVDNTTAASFSSGDTVELRLTSALLQDVIDQATVEGIKTNFQYVPTAGQTQFSGADSSGDTMIINDSELVNVYMNGVRLVQGSDYTVSSANNRITLTSGATTADIIDIEVFGNFTGQSGAAVAITGGAIAGTAITTGSINNTPIGATQANTVAATTLTANSLAVDNITIDGNAVDVSSSALTITADANPALEVSRGSANTTNVNLKYNTALTGQLSAANGKFQMSAAGSGTEMEFYTAGAKALEIDTSSNAIFSGNVGIAASNPTEKLEVSGSINTTNQSSNFTAGAQRGFLDMVNASKHVRIGSLTGAATATGTQGTVEIVVNNSAKVVVDENGHVGLGTANPNTNLQLYHATDDISLNVNHGTGGSYPKKSGISFGATSTSLGGDATFTGGAGIQVTNTAASNNPTEMGFFTTSGGTPAIRMLIDTDGDLLVGATTTTNLSDGTGNDGIHLNPSGTVAAARTSNVTAVFNRLSSDGEIVRFNKDGTTVGSIGSVTTDLYVGTGDTGIRFNDAVNGVLPFNTTTEAQVDGQLDLGFSSVRWRNLYLSAAAFADNYQFAQNSSAGSATEAIYRNTTGQITIRAGSEDLVRVDGANDIISLGGLPAGSVMTHGVIASNKAKATLGTSLGDTMRVFAVHGQTANSDFLTFGSRRITAGQSGWNHSVWDITRDIDNTSNLYRYMTFGIGETVINDNGDSNMNFRVETSSNEFGLKVHASSGAITVGQNTPSTLADGWYFGGLHSTHRHLVGTNTHATSANALLFLNRQNSSGGGVHIDFSTANSTVGTISTSASGTFYATTSDRRLKEDIAPVSDATSLLEKMNPVSFKWIANPEGDHEYGFIAQEMVEVMPEAVIGSEDEMTSADSPHGEGKPVYMQMDYGRITPIIVAALQEANKEIAALKARIQALEEEV